MTAPNQWTSGQRAILQDYIDTAQNALAANDLAGARAAIASYYSIQAAWGRGYAKLAANVVTDTTFEGKVAVDVLRNIGGSGVTLATETNLLVHLAFRDNEIMQNNGGLWPVMSQIEDYHFTIYRDDHIPVFAWGGAAFAYFDQQWDGGTLTSYELGDGSHSALFQGMTVAEVQQNVDALTFDGMLKIGKAVLLAEAAGGAGPGVIPQDALATLQSGIADDTPSFADLFNGVELAFRALALVNGNAELTAAQAEQAANRAFITATEGFFRSGFQDVSGFLNAIGSFIGRQFTGGSSASPADLSAIEANFSSNLPYLHVVQPGETYASIAAGLGMPGLTGQALADLNRGGLGDALAPGTIVLTPISATTLTSQPYSLTQPGDGQQVLIDLRTGLAMEAPLLGSVASSGPATVLDATGHDLADLAAGTAASALLGGGTLTLNLAIGSGAQLHFNTGDGSGNYVTAGTVQTTFGDGTVVRLNPNQIGFGANFGAENLLSSHGLASDGSLLGGTLPTAIISGDGYGALAMQASDAAGLLSAANVGVGLDTPSGPASNTLITNIRVADFELAGGHHLGCDPPGLLERAAGLAGHQPGRRQPAGRTAQPRGV